MIRNFLSQDIILDKAQERIISALEEIIGDVEDISLLAKLAFWKKITKPKGIYLYGGVGRGKSMIMKGFFDSLEVPNKKFDHYQNFMQDLHKRIHIERSAKSQDLDSVTDILAGQYTKEFSFLCLDELEIKDISDAMIIARLFMELSKKGVTIFVTSNTKPSDMYKDGVQRDLFMPFINFVEEDFELLHLDTHHDYRIDYVSGVEKRILFPNDRENKAKISQIINELTNKNLKPQSVEVFGRKVPFNKVYKTILVTDFDEMFKRDLGYADYVTICKHFTIIILENIKPIKKTQTDLAVRVINFVDNAYFNKVLLFASFTVNPKELYKEGARLLEFQRSLSRLQEMNSKTYLEEFHDKG